jgi:hypothetical protein
VRLAFECLIELIYLRKGRENCLRRRTASILGVQSPFCDQDSTSCVRSCQLPKSGPMSCTGLKIQPGMIKQCPPSSAIELRSCGMTIQFPLRSTQIDWTRVGTSPNFAIRSSAYSRRNTHKPLCGVTRITMTFPLIRITTTRADFTISLLQKQMIKRRMLSLDQDSRYIFS